MPALQVRDFPATLYDELKRYAAANHRSIAQQTIIAVEEMLATQSFLEEEGRRVNRSACKSRVEIGEAVSIPGLTDQTSSSKARRVERRKRLFKDFDEIAWTGPEPSTEDIVQMVREGRDHLSDRALRALEPFGPECFDGGEVVQ